MSRPPNVVLIVSDEHRAECAEPYGNMQVRTPALAGLAADGVVYDNSFCAFPVCAPSRYSLLTGLMPRRHLCLGNEATLPAGLPTFPRALTDIGYGTATVGKMHLSPAYLDVGFEQMILAEQNGDGRLLDDYHRHLREHALLDRADVTDQVDAFRRQAPPDYWSSFGAAASNLPEKFHSTTWIGDRAIEQIEAWDQRPQLLMVSFIKPHHPFDPPAEWLEAYRVSDIDLPPGWTPECLDRDLELGPGYFPWQDLTEPVMTEITRHYYATISHIDHQIDRILTALHDGGVYEDTLIVYTSDHGDYLGYHHMLLKGGLLYDPLARVPLIIKYPGSARTGRDTSLVSGIDIAATIVGTAGAAPIGTGLDLTPGPTDRDLITIEAPGPSHIMSRTTTHKLILRRDSGPLLFDLRTDPTELHDLSTDPAHRDVLDDLTARLTHHLLFAPPGNHKHAGAPTITAPNVPTDTNTAAADMHAWIDHRMRASVSQAERLEAGPKGGV